MRDFAIWLYAMTMCVLFLVSLAHLPLIILPLAMLGALLIVNWVIHGA